MNNLVKKIFTFISIIIVPTLIGAILSNYLHLTLTLFISLVVGLVITFIYMYFNTKFLHIDSDIHSIENQFNELKEKIGFGVGNKLSWIEFWSKIQELIGEIEKDGFDPDIVISIGRSGAVLGGIIASNLGSKHHIGIDRNILLRKCKDGSNRTDIEIDTSLIPNKEKFKNKKLLIVMSECDTGLTLRVFYDYFMAIKVKEVKTAVLFKRKNVHFGPHFYIVSTDKDWPELPFRIDDKWLPHHPQLIVDDEIEKAS